MYIRGCQKFGIKVYWRLQFLGYLRTLNLKFQKAQTKIEVVLTLPCWLSQFRWTPEYIQKYVAKNKGIFMNIDLKQQIVIVQ